MKISLLILTLFWSFNCNAGVVISDREVLDMFKTGKTTAVKIEQFLTKPNKIDSTPTGGFKFYYDYLFMDDEPFNRGTVVFIFDENAILIKIEYE